MQVCCAQQSRTFCGHSLDFPTHSTASPPPLLFYKSILLINAMTNQSLDIPASSASSLQHITHYVLLFLPFSWQLSCTSACTMHNAHASGASLWVSGAPLKGLSVQDQQLTCLCAQLQAAGVLSTAWGCLHLHTSSAHLHKLTAYQTELLCKWRIIWTHDQLSNTLQNKKQNFIYELSL